MTSKDNITEMTDPDIQPKLYGMGIYTDEDTGQLISTHSMLKTFRRCPKQTQYKYLDRLKPKVIGRPLRFGTWMHSLYEAYYKGEDWVEKNKQLTAKFATWFDEEKERTGDLPRDCARTMRSYLWHYEADPWKVHDVEFMLEVTLPDGNLYRCKLDMLIENQFGLWVVDHKNMRSLPDHNFRLLDAQSALYVWAALKNKIPVQGHIWNYIRSKAPTIPKPIQDGSRLSKRDVDTDYPTLMKAIKQAKLDPNDYKAWRIGLMRQRYATGIVQTSPFFRRDTIEKTPAMLKQVATEAYATHVRMHSYHWDKTTSIERVPDRSCAFGCSYVDLCTTELFGGNADLLRRQRYGVGDPLDYYFDESHHQEEGKVF